MKIGIVSDLHLDCGHAKIKDPPVCDILVIAGDTCPITKLIFRDHNTEWEGQAQEVYKYLDVAVKNAKQVIITLGNHESDHGIFEYTANMARKAFQKYPTVTVLHNEFMVIGDYVFYGGTCWTDFNKGGVVEKVTAKLYMSDYREIQTFNGFGELRPLEPQDTYEAHLDWYAGLQQARDYAASWGKDIVVITHHCPSKKSSSDRYGNGPENHAFYSNLEDEFGAQIPLWIHGHTHDSYDYVHLGTRVVCNPRGYGFSHHSLNKSFDPNKVIELP